MTRDLPVGGAIRVRGLSNREFLVRHAGAGRVGLSGGTTLVDRAICRAERHLVPDERWGIWSHAFVFEGARVDDQHWLIESDLQILRRHIQLGVQENRIDKYFDEQIYPNLAVLDFELGPGMTKAVVAGGLDLAANHARYSLRELAGTLLALKNPALRGRGNLLARGNSLFCSALVQHLFRRAGLDLAPGIDLKNTTPEDLARTPVPHRAWVLQRAEWGDKPPVRGHLPRALGAG